MGTPFVAFALAIAASCLPAGAAFAQEPLFLRIRPNDAALSNDGAADRRAQDDADAARVRAAREAVWERSDRRARIAIASICEGCLSAPTQDITVAASPSAPATPAAIPGVTAWLTEAEVPRTSQPDSR